MFPLDFSHVLRPFSVLLNWKDARLRSAKKKQRPRRKDSLHLCELSLLAAYVPRLVLNRLIRNAANLTQYLEPHSPSSPSHVSSARARLVCEGYNDACLLVADVSGFTKLNEAFAALGPGGVEQVTIHLNKYFTSILDIIQAHGGDTVKFAGDALIVIFTSQLENKSNRFVFSVPSATVCGESVVFSSARSQRVVALSTRRYKQLAVQ